MQLLCCSEANFSLVHEVSWQYGLQKSSDEELDAHTKSGSCHIDLRMQPSFTGRDIGHADRLTTPDGVEQRTVLSSREGLDYVRQKLASGERQITVLTLSVPSPQQRQYQRRLPR